MVSALDVCARQLGSAAASSRLEQVIAQASQLLPAQGPITVFIHHNTLHAFEELTFDEGVQAGARTFGCQPYLTEDRYRQELARGRIRLEDLAEILVDDLRERADALIGPLGTRYHLRLAMLQHPLRSGPSEELRWFIAETDALTRFPKKLPTESRERLVRETRLWVLDNLRNGHDHAHREMLTDLLARHGAASMESWSEATWESLALQTLWRTCREGVHCLAAVPAKSPEFVRPRDWLLEATGEDSDRLVNELVIRFSAAFLDQGMAPWTLPHRAEGFFRAFIALYRQSAGPPDRWLSGLAAELDRLEAASIGPLESILESLDMLGVEEADWNEFLSETLLSLRGWAGMIQQMELRADRVRFPAQPGSVIEFLAVRLILERLALKHVAQTALRLSGSLGEIPEVARRRIVQPPAVSVDQRAFLLFQLAQGRGWSAPGLLQMPREVWSLLMREIEAFSSIERRRVFHRAYERKFRVQTLDALAIHGRKRSARVESPKFQAIFCIDEREESMRRHLEEIAPDTETFGAAGFFSVAMYYRGAADAHFVPLCPIVIRPQHWVVEDVAFTAAGAHQRRAKTREMIGRASHRAHVGSRGFLGGALITAGLGVLASIPLVARVLFPRLTAMIRGKATGFVQPPSGTRLQLERTSSPPSCEENHIGFTVEEMTNVAERLLRDIGLTSGFARLVAIIGHGSNSANNPHESAHDCGACGGARGGPNARAVAEMLNDPRVRNHINSRGLQIPNDTVFVGAYHNTCNEALTFFDLDRLPPSHDAEFTTFQNVLEQACAQNAHERCRRFLSAPLNLSFAAARRHVEARAEDLAQVRPEWGHATNAICIVGRRERTRGLYFDRRAFLVSYDPLQDDAESAILTRILQAVVPVCGGINLEYYFSYIDSPGWGCGTKLPHNITSLLGVMDGAASDLRTGLPWQMVEIHEPVRLLFVLESTPAAVLKIFDRNPAIKRMCVHGWVQVATLCPNSAEIHVLCGDHFEPYRAEANELRQAASSADWYRGQRDHLEFAEIVS